MRIAQVAPLAESVPPKLYGGTERVVSWLTEELVRQGHNVTLFASGNSETAARLVAHAPQGLRLTGIRDHTSSLLVMLSDVRRRADEFDIIHVHVDQLHIPLFADIRQKCITTLHGRLDLPDFHPIHSAFPHMPRVSISDSQRLPMPPGLDWLATVHHGMPPNTFTLHPDPGGYLAFLGRMSPEKGPERAIEVARRVGMPLKMAAKVDAVDEEYFEHKIRPLLDDPLVEFVGEISQREKDAFLGNALALLFPINWPEPFGLVMIEAMAVGTPVIALRAGSVPEVVDDGISGVIVDDLDGMVNAVMQIHDLSRHAVRERFELRFTSKRMARGYIRAYKRSLALGATVVPARQLRLPAPVIGEGPPALDEPRPVAHRLIAAVED